jgi:glycosyltransferase involved in cell wall biosynthesis
MTIVEAYAVGTPVIGARIGGIPEIVQDESTGFLFESRYVVSLTNTINKANELTDAQYASLSSECQAFASENFNQETYVTKLIIFLNEVYNKYNS